jgi:hypothetical protein
MTIGSPTSQERSAPRPFVAPLPYAPLSSAHPPIPWQDTHRLPSSHPLTPSPGKALKPKTRADHRNEALGVFQHHRKQSAETAIEEMVPSPPASPGPLAHASDESSSPPPKGRLERKGSQPAPQPKPIRTPVFRTRPSPSLLRRQAPTPSHITPCPAPSLSPPLRSRTHSHPRSFPTGAEPARRHVFPSPHAAASTLSRIPWLRAEPPSHLTHPCCSTHCPFSHSTARLRSVACAPACPRHIPLPRSPHACCLRARMF